MKNLLLLTDFSKSAKHAANYSYSLAEQMAANLTLCNAVLIPLDIPQAGLIVWPMPDTSVLLQDSETALKKLKASLEKSHHHDSKKPKVSLKNLPGTPLTVVKELTQKSAHDFVIMAAHGGGLSSLLLGNHTRTMINQVGAPLFIIPAAAKIKPIKNIGFATDFKDPERDMKFIKQLVEFANTLNAEVFITHVCSEEECGPAFDKSVEKILIDICAENNYSKIQYKAVLNSKPKKGLEWLIDSGDIDLLVLIHHHQDFFDRILRHSLSSSLATDLMIPLLIYKQAIDPSPIS